MKILVVVDMQNDFISGSLGTPEAQAILPKVKEKIAMAIANGDEIIYTKDTHFNDYLYTKEGQKLPVEHCIIDTWGWEIANDLYVEGYRIVEKPSFGSFELLDDAETIGWNNAKRGNTLEEIELIGLCTDICVVSNALMLKASFYNDVEISVDATCCAGVTPETHEAALKAMEMCQINVKRG